MCCYSYICIYIYVYLLIGICVGTSNISQMCENILVQKFVSACCDFLEYLETEYNRGLQFVFFWFCDSVFEWLKGSVRYLFYCALSMVNCIYTGSDWSSRFYTYLFRLNRKQYWRLVLRCWWLLGRTRAVVGMYCYLIIDFVVGIGAGTDTLFQWCVNWNVSTPLSLDGCHFLNRTFAAGIEVVFVFWKIRGWARFILLFCLWGVVFVLNTTDGSRNRDLERWHAVSYFFMNCDKDSDEISIVTRSIFARLMLAFLFWDFCGIFFSTSS